ncbi:putative hydroxyacylglutathione hydrolase C13B11.03c [Grifola frondosa]|uniref:hydroxyacylglutathione hydrolase n=1 Tax=Grifola frondosa TaxID=5627 RepID=A0A1C7MFI1_GRIFR|nr:putative hydroxyacylglutathione hydrolase C13B11.03c [Grifola frondosa]
MKVLPVPVREDNYAYLLIDEASQSAAAVDPYDVPKVKAAAENAGVQIVAGITTHHHFDHSGGNQVFASTYPDVPIYGGSERVPALTNLVKDKEEFSIGAINVKCLATPCHTQDSICYYATDANSTHPGGTTVYNGHEYTKGNLAFAKSVDPENPALARLEGIVHKNKITTGLTTIADEKQWNPFMRLDSASIQKATGGGEMSAVMDELRDQKNNYRGEWPALSCKRYRRKGTLDVFGCI